MTKVRVVENTEHARIGPSKLAQALRCPGSVDFIADLEDDAGIPAAQGSILHSFCESALIEDRPAEDYIGECREHDGYRYTLDEVDAEMMQEGLDIIDTLPGKLFVEKRLDLDRFMPRQFGTMDVGVISKKSSVAHVWDWKWGFVPVSPINHEQTMAYGLGCYYNFIEGRPQYDHIDRVRLHIWQPRTPRGGGEWEIKLDDLIEWGRTVRPKIERCFDPDAPRIAGPVQCQYCPGARHLMCPEYDAYNLAMVIADFDEIDERMKLGVGPRLKTSKQMTPELRAYIIQNRAMIDKWLDRLENDTLDDALKGRPTPGQKAVEGRRPTRKWLEADEKRVRSTLEGALGDDAYTRKLLTPTQAEKELPPKLWNKLSAWIKPEKPKAILVSEEDARPALDTVVDEFEDLD